MSVISTSRKCSRVTNVCISSQDVCCEVDKICGDIDTRETVSDFSRLVGSGWAEWTDVASCARIQTYQFDFELEDTFVFVANERKSNVCKKKSYCFGMDRGHW